MSYLSLSQPCRLSLSLQIVSLAILGVLVLGSVDRTSHATPASSTIESISTVSAVSTISPVNPAPSSSSASTAAHHVQHHHNNQYRRAGAAVPKHDDAKDEIPTRRAAAAVTTITDALYGNCDVGAYYVDQDTDPWNWKREDIALLLMATHRNVVGGDSVHGADTAAPTASSAPSDDVALALALADLDRGTTQSDDGTGTVRMVLTGSEVPASPLDGWTPGHLWPLGVDLPTDVGSPSPPSAPTAAVLPPDDVTYLGGDDQERHDEWVAALSDLHNLRPQPHPSIIRPDGGGRPKCEGSTTAFVTNAAAPPAATSSSRRRRTPSASARMIIPCSHPRHRGAKSPGPSSTWS
jgi:hypothetical protein